MKNILLLLALATLLACNSKDTIHEITLDAADAAYQQFDLERSRTILLDLLAIDTLNSSIKCQALQRLALQDWKYFKNHDLALKRLHAADSIGLSKLETWNLISRIERESGNYQQSLAAATKGEKFAGSAAEATSAKLEFAQTVYEQSVNNLSKNIPLDTALLNRSSLILSKILESNAGAPQPSRLLLAISLLRNDGANVINAWKSYFHIADINSAYPYMANAAKNLNEVCEKWRGEKLTLENQEKLILALSDSRFYEYAGDFALHNSSEESCGSTVTDILTYAKYLKEVKSETNEYYRQIAIGQENERAYKKWLGNARKELWHKLSFLAGMEYSNNGFLDETKKHFGAMGFTGSTANYSGYVLCLGHIVNQEKALVKQYGYAPELTYTQLDMMTSNGYSSWFWENGAIGGWATDNEVIRVREAYLDEPFNAWKTATETLERRKTLTRINEFLNQPYTEDIDKQTGGLAAKLRFDAITDLYHKLYSEGLRGNDLKMAFLSTFEKYRVEASILGHEGRHSIERKYMPEKFKNWSNDEREFHAKLSQIIFATEPRFELAGMIDEIGESGHGMANKKIVDTAIDWIKKNCGKIEGYTPDKSLLSQLYLLTNEQIKECYQSVDPLFAMQKR